MEAHYHLIIALMFGLGAVVGGFLIDLDHGGTIKEKWHCFRNPYRPGVCTNLQRGIFHNPVVAFSIIAFCIGLALSYLIHILMDYVPGFWGG